ncbi:hypothetical protein E2P81_ATG02111 [Venturia nashicola]|uniref:Uncharacterized protein n=1 Tax=Venturia nashicola TaxID=86259 RepID=A0A4Z1P5S3_9PEZI|nr:hypothetical protein E6O75_ATG02162 [Venturia nashicola]TLD35808.1 hypothetical protein E2P81_ATG02111 [Venturia nashicola]
MLNLDSLPLELQFEVYSYLVHPLSSYKHAPFPTTYVEQREVENLPSGRAQLMQHPYCQLAATCDSIRDSVEAYCLHLIKGQTLLKTGHGGTKISKPQKDNWRTKIAKARASPKYPSGLPQPNQACRNIYLRSVYQKCIFCRAVTKRRAAFNRFMWCDKKCDVEHYGRLISKTEAANQHQVQEIHWQNPHLVFPESTWRPLRMTLYNTSACASTTLLLEKEVIKMAEYIKANDADGKKLRLAKQAIANQKLADEAKALIKAEDDFIKFANDRFTVRSRRDFEKAAAFLRTKLHPQVVQISRLGPGPEQLAERLKLCQNLTMALPQSIREFCKVEVKKSDDWVYHRLDIVRSYNGAEHSYRVLDQFFPLL